MKLRRPKGTKTKESSGGQTSLTNTRTKAVLIDESDVETHDAKEGSASAGISMGVTIPGPSGSYMSARCDAWANIPCQNTDKAIRAAYRRASKLAQAQLQKDAETVSDFFTTV